MTRRFVQGRAAAVVVCLLASTIASVATAQTSEESLLEDAKNQIAEVAAELRRAQSQRADAEGALAAATSQLRRIEAAVNEAADAFRLQEAALAEADRHLAELLAKEAEQRRDIGRFTAQIYKGGGPRDLDALLRSSSIDQALDRQAYMRRITSRDRALLEEVANTQKAVAVQRAHAEEERDRFGKLKAEREALLVDAAALRQHRALAAASAGSEADRLNAEKHRLEEDARKLTIIIRARQQPPPSSASPSTSGYIWPVCGPVTSGYGYRWGRLHAGIDIDGNTGDPIYAAKGGRVIFAGWQGGYGNLVMVDHKDGVVTAYAHQSRLLVGEGAEVVRGDRVGLMGSTGYSTGSHLHFETRVNGTPTNPRKFLPSSC